MTPIEQELCSEISKAVELIVAASYSAATKALDQAFGRGVRESRTNLSVKRRSLPTSAVRRSQEELAELTRQLHQAICDAPGQLMSTLAAQLGSTPQHLQTPVARLKAERLIKTVGQRQSTCYFPKSASGA